MKKLLVMRHAKSSWQEPGLSDYERPLNNRGRKAAPRMGKLLVDEDSVPHVILNSSATRARQTSELLKEAMGFSGQSDEEDSFYLAAPQAYIDRLRCLDDDLECAMVIGHNPGLEDLVIQLTGESCVMPTAAIAVIQLDIDRWFDLTPHVDAELSDYWRPKSLD